MLLAEAVGRSGLAAARSLSRRGVSFVAVGHEPKGMVAASRHVGRYVEAPSAEDDPQAFLDVVIEICAKGDVRLVIPVLDATLAVCSEDRECLPEGTTLAVPDAEAVRNVLDKRLNLETARRLDVRCPAEFALESFDQIPELIDRIGFPMVLKNPGWGSDGSRPASAFKWQIAKDERGLRTLLVEHSAGGRFPVCQELVEGIVTNLCCFVVDGEIVAAQQYRSLRRLAWAGVAVLREIVASDPRLVEQAGRLLAELQWDGVAHVAFVVRPSDGATWYMETNGRFWGSIETSIATGWDFPYWQYRYFAHGDVPAPPPPAIGRRSCWHFGDLQLLQRRLRGIEPPVPPGPGTRRAIADYLSGFAPGVRSDVFRLDDPLPDLVEHWEWIRGGVAKRLRQRTA